MFPPDAWGSIDLALVLITEYKEQLIGIIKHL